MADNNTYHLTGSRFFRTATKESDWDFFAEESAMFYLEENGWLLTCPADMYDAVTFVKGNVHVQLVEDILLKLRVQSRLTPVMREGPYTKRQARVIWNVASTMLKSYDEVLAHKNAKERAD